jgi:small-conductance mechanosensitive channel
MFYIDFNQIWMDFGRTHTIAFCVFILIIAVLAIIKKTVVRHLKHLSKKTKTDVDDFLIQAINEIHWPFYLFISLYFSVELIKLPTIIEKVLDYAIIIVVVFYVIKFIQKIIEFSAYKIKLKGKAKDPHFDASVVDLLTKIVKIILWVIAVLLILSNIGYDITTLAAGLGIGGIAIAFALQNVLSDIFASFSIYFDKPFKVGDFIIIGTDAGRVKHVGIKTTRIQTLQGQELIVSNKELTETRINNYRRMKKRRVKFNLGVTYDTSSVKLKKIPVIIKNIFAKVKNAELVRVHFHQFGDFSLNFEIVYSVNSKEMDVYMDTQQEINFAIKEEFEKEKIEMAFPTQTVYVNK